MRRAFFVTVAITSLATPLRAQVPSIPVGVGGELSALLGETLNVPLFADMSSAGGEKLGSYTVRLSWDPAVLWYGGFTSGSFAEAVARTDSTGAGVLWLTGISAAGSGGLVDLAVIHFSVSTAATSIMDVQVTELSAAGTLTDLTSGAVPVSGTFCPGLGRWGDLDASGGSDSRDALAILTAVVGLTVPAGFDVSLGDVDGDGSSNTRDALIVLSYAVGLDVPGQRVLLVAGGSCATNETPGIVVVPDTADLVIGQRVTLRAFGENATGQRVALDGLSWESADPLVAFAGTMGEVLGRDTGTTTVTAALGPGVSVSATVIVRARRPVWYVDATKASRATVQLGTMRWPFSTPERAFGLVSEGDTIRIAPGVHDYEGTGQVLNVGVVVVGDTLTDGTRPVLRAAEFDWVTAFEWWGGDHAEVRDLVLRGFYTGAGLYGLRNLVFHNVRVEEPLTTSGYGIYVEDPMDTLIVRRSDFLADTSLSSYAAIYVDDGATLAVVDSSTFFYWGDGGFYAYDVDSLDMQDSEISLGDYTGISMFTWNRPSVAARLSRNRFYDNYYEAIEIYDARTVAMDHNFIFEARDDAVVVYGLYPNVASKVTMLGDSILFAADDWDWIDVNDMDSVLIDSLYYESDVADYEYGYISSRYVSITNSEFKDVVDEVLNVSAEELVVDNSAFTGCSTCVRDADALWVSSFNSVGPKITLTNSSFSNVYYGLWSTTSNTGAGPIVIANNTVSEANYGFHAHGDGQTITDNVLSEIYTTGIEAEPSFTTGVAFLTASIARNTVSCTTNTTGHTGLLTRYHPTAFDANTLNSCGYGIYALNNTSYPVASLTMTGNAVTGDPSTSFGVGIWVDGSRYQSTLKSNRVSLGDNGIFLPTQSADDIHVLDSNVVEQTNMLGIRVSGSALGASVTGRWNNVKNNFGDGILLQTVSGIPVSFNDGRFVGNGATSGWAINKSGSATADATNNWWGQATGANTPGADSVFNTTDIDVANPLGSDPEAVTVPASSPATVAAMRRVSGQERRVSGEPVPPRHVEGAGGVRATLRRDELRSERRAAKDAEREARRARAEPPKSKPQREKRRRPTRQ